MTSYQVSYRVHGTRRNSRTIISAVSKPEAVATLKRYLDARNVRWTYCGTR